MQPVTFAGANTEWKRPEGTTEQQCSTLPVLKGVTKFGAAEAVVSRSAWKPSEEELEMLNAGSVVYLDVFGVHHPVVSVTCYEREIEPIEKYLARNRENGHTK